MAEITKEDLGFTTHQLPSVYKGFMSPKMVDLQTIVLEHTGKLLTMGQLVELDQELKRYYYVERK